MVEELLVAVAELVGVDLPHHDRGALLQPVEIDNARTDKDYNLLQHGTEPDNFDIVSIGWRIDCTFDLDVCLWLWGQKLDTIVLEL